MNTSPLPVWNSLEVVKLVVAAATPVILAVIGFWMTRVIKRVEHSQWRNQKVIEKRMQVYDLVAPDLNKLFCYFTYVRTWKEQKPRDVITLKRNLDATVFGNEWLFSAAFILAYEHLIECCFVAYQGSGHDARLRTHREERKTAAGQSWVNDWDRLFKEDDVPPREDVLEAYSALMTLFATELGAPRKAHRETAIHHPAASKASSAQLTTSQERDTAAGVPG